MKAHKGAPRAPETIDGEHRIQLGLLDALRQALRVGSLEASLHDIIEQLRDYSQAHFTSEQLLMRLSACPDQAAHVAEHRELLDDLQRLSLKLAAAAGLAADDAELLRERLLHHIGQTDAAFARHYALWLRAPRRT